MSGDEMLALVAFLAIGAWTWIAWLVPVGGRAGSKLPWGLRLALFALPVACAAMLLFVLGRWSSFDVRGSTIYTFFYLVFGAAWVGFGARYLHWVGLSARDDVIERRNWAAYAAIAGALIGLTLAFAGANVGNGPGWWVVVFSAGLSTLGLLLAWLLVNLVARAHEHVTIDRDLASGLRTGALLAACGAILGRAAAGDWVGMEATTVDFVRVGWPAAALALVGAILERLVALDGSTPRRNILFYGLLPALAFLGGAAAELVRAGYP